MIIPVRVGTPQTELPGRLIEDLAELLQVLSLRAHAVKRLHSWSGEGAALDGLGGTPAEAGWRLCSGIVRGSFLFNSSGDLGDGVGHYVEGVLHVDQLHVVQDLGCSDR
jgi:hypothetical protein